MLRTLWNAATSLLSSAGKYGTGAAIGLGGAAAVSAASGSLGGTIKDVVNFGAETSGGAGPESSFAMFYKFLQKIGEMVQKLTNGKYGQGLIDFGKDGLDTRPPEEKLADMNPLSEERQGQRIYDHAHDPLRFSVAGPNGSPPSVQFSDADPSTANTVNLGIKAAKDGLGVVTGSVAGALGWVADGIGIDALYGGSLGWDSGWGSKSYNGVAGATNNITDYIVYNNPISHTGFAAVGGMYNWAVKGQSLTEAFSNSWNTSYEPTIRSESDLDLYDGISKTSGIILGTLAGGWGAATAGIGGATAATGGSFIGNAFRTVASGLGGLGKAATTRAPAPVIAGATPTPP